MILPGSYANGFAPRDGRPLYPELWRGCVGAWAPYLGPTGLILRDWSAYKNHGTLTNMDAATDWVVSQGRYALDVDGSNDYVDCGTRLSQLDGAGEFTMCFWGRRRSSNAPLTVGKRSGSNFILIAPWIDGNVYFEISPNFPSVASNTTTWLHYGMTLKQGTIRGYINGVEVVAGAGPATLPSAAANYVMGLEQGVMRYSDGWLEEMRVYSRAMTANEFRRLASRQGIAYEFAPRRRSSSAVQFNRRRRLLVGASS